MFQLKAFVGERLSAAAGEIFGEFEKTIALYKAELSRSKEEVDNLRKQLKLQGEKSAAEPPSANSTVIGEGYDSTLVQENLLPLAPFEMGKGCNLSPRPEVPGPSQTNAGIENTHWNYCMFQTDPEISPIKVEQEELGIDCQKQQAICPSPDFVKSDQDQEAEVTLELEPLSSDCSTDQSESSDDEDWMESKGAQTESKKWKAKTVQREADRTTQEGCEELPREDSSAKSQKDDRSFCHLCGKTFQYIGSLMKHIKMHDKTADCFFCRITFQSTEELINHLQSAHNKTHFCNVCGKTFAKMRFLRVHSKIHTGLKPFSCQDCGKEFLRKEHLIVHARTHSGEKPYCCEICGKAFSQSQSLTVHKRSHTGEKLYHCNVCGKLFNTSSHLKTHMRYHSGEKPYSCDICGRHFRQSGQLTSHKRIHTGERPYGCHVCGIRYKFGANLKMHMKVHEKESTVAASTWME